MKMVKCPRCRGLRAYADVKSGVRPCAFCRRDIRSREGFTASGDERHAIDAYRGPIYVSDRRWNGNPYNVRGVDIVLSDG